MMFNIFIALLIAFAPKTFGALVENDVVFGAVVVMMVTAAIRDYVWLFKNEERICKMLAAKREVTNHLY